MLTAICFSSLTETERHATTSTGECPGIKLRAAHMIASLSENFSAEFRERVLKFFAEAQGAEVPPSPTRDSWTCHNWQLLRQLGANQYLLYSEQIVPW